VAVSGAVDPRQRRNYFRGQRLPVSSANVFWAIYQAETRKGSEGVLDPSQAMPREAMFYAYTRNSAHAMNLDSIGTIAAASARIWFCWIATF